MNIESGENGSTTGEHSESTSGSAGVDIDNGSVTPSAGGSKTDSDTKVAEVSYTPTTLQGDSIEIVSGGNTNIKGSIISGKNVKLDIGGNLDITSDQNSYTYNSKNSSVGFNIGLKSGSAQASTGKTDYTLKTVVEQAGINAGEEGLDINVKGKTTLTGAVIDSKADKTKNQITTGDLEMKNIENVSSEKDSNTGIGYSQGSGVKANEKALIPMLPIAGKDQQKSTTYAAIVDGKLVVTGNKNFKEEDVNRNTENTLNALANTLDTQKIAERKKLAELFAKNAFEQVHRLSDEMKLEEGSAGKVLLHAVVAGITAKLGGDSFYAGSMAGAINEIMNGEISRYEKAHNKGLTPAEHQWLSAAVGAIVNSATGSTIQTGMADAVYATKWNYLSYYQREQMLKELEGKSEEEKEEIIKKYEDLNDSQGEEWLSRQGQGSYLDIKTNALVIIGEKEADTIMQGIEEKGWGSTECGKSFVMNLTTTLGDLPYAMVAEMYDGKKVLIKGLRFSGPNQVIGTAYSFYEDTKKYSGKDLVKAGVIDIVAAGTGVAAGAAISIVGAPVILTIGGTVVAGVIVDKASDYAKNIVINNDDIK